MDAYVGRILEINRLLPDEVERLHNEEKRETIPVDFDPETGTCAGVIHRIQRCWMSWEIQQNFHRPPIKDYYHLSGKGVFADQQTFELMEKLNRAVKQVLFENAKVIFSKCGKCGWTETTWDGLWVNGEWGPHEEECQGTVRANVVREVESLARLTFNSVNVYGMHGLDAIIEKRKERLNAVLSEFRDVKNKPKTRLEKIKEEREKSLI